jgi:hypothetical protein
MRLTLLLFRFRTWIGKLRCGQDESYG